jgi:hypothetical protein
MAFNSGDNSGGVNLATVSKYKEREGGNSGEDDGADRWVPGVSGYGGRKNTLSGFDSGWAEAETGAGPERFPSAFSEFFLFLSLFFFCFLN